MKSNSNNDISTNSDTAAIDDDRVSPGAKPAKGRGLGRKKKKEEATPQNEPPTSPGAKPATGPGLRKNRKNKKDSGEEKGNTQSVGNAVENAATASGIEGTTGRGLRNNGAAKASVLEEEIQGSALPAPGALPTTGPGLRKNNKNNGLSGEKKDIAPVQEVATPSIKEATGRGLRNTANRIRAKQQAEEVCAVPQPATAATVSATKGFERGIGQTNRYRQAKAQASGKSNPAENQCFEEDQPLEQSQEPNNIDTNEQHSEKANQQIDGVEQGTENHGLTDIETPSHPHRHPLSPITGVSNSGLAHAKPVTEDSQPDLMQAQQVDPAELERKAAEKTKNKQCLAIGFCISTVAIGVATILGVVFGTSSKNIPVKLAPSAFPSMAPSDSPSFAPSSALDTLYSILPNGTLESLSDPFSPQSKAHSWLSGHQNISYLPEWRKTQLFALATFYYAMHGDSWPSEFTYTWLKEDREECFWQSNEFGKMRLDGTYLQAELLREWETPYQLEPCNNEGRIQNLFLLLVLNLPRSEAPPIIPPELALLTSLSILALPQNNIHATLAEFLPTEFYLMTSLKSVDLSYNGFSGSLPREIGLMNSLTGLDLYGNSISGALPSEMGLMNSLTGLDLYGSRFSGSLPSEMGLMNSLTWLDLHGNSISGALPCEMGLMTSLAWLDLSHNGFSGSLPREIGLMNSLTGLDLYGSRFSGSLPSEMGLMISLTELLIEHSDFSGALPSQMGLMTSLTSLDLGSMSFSGALPSQMGLMASLASLILYDNSFSGALPSETGLMTSLTSLALDGNSFSGVLPSELWLMPSLLLLRLFFNTFSGALPSEMGLMTSLTELDLHMNSFSAALPSEMALMTSMTSLRLEYNSFSGALPSELGMMTSLTSLVLQHNSFSEALPSELRLMSSLTGLNLHSNSFSGSLPSEMGLMNSLTWLKLYGNSISGALPCEMGLMTSLESVDLGYNGFSGSLPREIGLMTSLTGLDLCGNSFSGALPSEMGLMTILAGLYLEGNSFSGALPSEMGLMTSLTEVNLGGNILSGALPSEIGPMTSLAWLSLHSNSFSGVFPSEMGLMTSLTKLNLHNNSFSGTVPLELKNLATNGSLMELDLRDTSLTGTVPESLCSILDAVRESGLLFDCSELLCGCCSCPCAGSNYTGKCTVNNPVSFYPSEDDEAWPGLFPPSANESNSLAINVRTDDYPGETSVEWSIRNESALWLVLRAQNATNASSLHSYIQDVEWDTLYRLQLFDIDGDGICCSNGFGWLTVTNSTPSNDFADGSVVWEARGDVFGSSLELHIWIDSNGNAQLVDAQFVLFLFDPPREDEEWPGAFPPPANQSNALTINVRTDDYPEETSMEWSIWNESGLWQTLDTQNPANASSLHSNTYDVESDSLYRLHLSEGYGKGTCCDYGFGWFTITNSTPTYDLEDGSVVWEARGDVLASPAFSEDDRATWEEITLDVFIWVSSNGLAQVIDHIPEEQEQGWIQDQAMEHDNSTLVPLAEGQNSTTNEEVTD